MGTSLRRGIERPDRQSGPGRIWFPLAKQRPTNTVIWAELIAEIAARKDREAFRTLFEFFAPRIKAFLLRRGSDAAEAEEIAQEAMIAVWRKADQFDPATTGAAAWIFTIARNLKIDAVRRGRRTERLLKEVEAEYLPEAAESAETDFSRRQDAGRVEASLKRLPVEQSEVIRLSFIEERTHAEIVALLGIPLGTVKSRVRLAMGRLRELLDDRNDH
jgi:RNA polymerase sigma factor (sigma-70 family)